MSTDSFVHLHCHSHFSLLDGASPIGALVDKAKSLGMNALALTDHGNLYGALEFYQKAKAAGINPVIGYEAYIAPGDRRHKEVSKNEEASYHLTLAGSEPHRLPESDQVVLVRVSGWFLSQAADRQGNPRRAQRRPDLPQRLRFGRVQPRAAARGQSRPGNRRGHADCGLVPQAVRRSLLHRDPEQRARHSAHGDGGRRRHRPPHGPAAGRHERLRITSIARTPKPRTCCCASTPVDSAPTPIA